MSLGAVMSDSTTIIDPQEFRPLIHQTVDALGEADLAAVDELLLEVDRVAGEHDAIVIEQAVRHYQQRQPCC